MEHLDTPMADFRVHEFVANHHATPEMVQHARAIAEGNQTFIEEMTRQGKFSLARFEEILNDYELNKKYALMAEAWGNDDKEKFEEMYKKIANKIDLVCGWLSFQNEYLQLALAVPMIYLPRGKQIYQDFIRENG